MIQIEDIMSQVKELPTFPAAVARLSKIISADDFSAADIEKIIRPDMTLTANLLRLANSAYFGFSREITSVRQTISLMGIKRVFELAVSCSMVNVIPKVIPGYRMRAYHFCLHGIATAVYSERLADVFQVAVPDLLFTTGLLHDIGKLVLGNFLEPEQEAVLAQINQGKALLDIERDLLGMDHSEVGSIMAQVWNLPPLIEVAARWHHAPSEMGNSDYQTMVDLVHVADGIAHLVGFGGDIAGLLRKVDPTAVERLKIDRTTLQKIVLETLDEVRDLAKLIISPNY